MVSKKKHYFTRLSFPRLRCLTHPDTPTLCASSYVDDYLQSYADHFQLRSRIRLNASIRTIKRDDAGNKWLIEVAPVTSDGSAPEAETLIFDKVVLATGSNEKPSTPTIEGIDSFKGRVLHSQAFKKCVNHAISFP